MKIKAIAPWFGGKRNLGPEIVEALGPHSAYWEPFCGSLAILLGKEPCRQETVNDLHGELINLARVLACRRTAEELYERLSRFLLHEDFLHEKAESWKSRGYQPAPEVPDVDRAEEFMFCSWAGRNGVAGTRSYNQGFCVRYTKSGGHAATRWTSAVESIPDWHERLRTVTILNRDAFEILGKIEDAAGTVIYCDPPYLKKGCLYIHDFESEDHQRLATALRRFKRTRVVVSYYDDLRLQELYPGWSRRRLKSTKALVNQSMREKGGTIDAPEVLLINAPAGLFG